MLALERRNLILEKLQDEKRTGFLRRPSGEIWISWKKKVLQSKATAVL